MSVEELIEKYPKIFQQYEGNPGMVNWLDLPEGWVETVDWLCHSIQSYIDNINEYNTHLPPVEQVVCLQMKEKFGGLRFYTFGNDDRVEGMIHMAEIICDTTCQICGSHEDIGHTSGWIITLCRKCGTSERYQKNWKSEKEWKEEREKSLKK